MESEICIEEQETEINEDNASVDNEESSTEISESEIDSSETGITTDTSDTVNEVNVEEVNSVDETSTEGVNADTTSTGDNTAPAFELKLEKSSDGIVVSLHFIFSDSIYVMSGEKAESLGIPVNRIKAGVVQRTNSALPMTEDEARLKVFAKDISSDAEKCNELFDLLFS